MENNKHKIQQAEDMAIKALAFIGEDDDRMYRFFSLTGFDSDDIAAAITEPAFQAGILDYLLSHEPDLIEFAKWADIDPMLPMKIRHMLPE